MQVKSGQRLRSQVDATEIIVVRPLPGDVDLRCGGMPLIDARATPEPGLVAVEQADGGGAALGKRYTDPTGGLEVLVTKAGRGSLSVGDAMLTPKDAKPLPSSD